MPRAQSRANNTTALNLYIDSIELQLVLGWKALRLMLLLATEEGGASYEQAGHRDSFS